MDPAGEGGEGIFFTSPMGGLFTPPGCGVYVSTKHALEAIAEVMQQELRPFGIKVQTINPGAYLTGYNETMADTTFRWLDDSRNFTKPATMREIFDSLLGRGGRLDPAEMIDRMIEIVPADTGKFRNVVLNSSRTCSRSTSSRHGTARFSGGRHEEGHAQTNFGLGVLHIDHSTRRCGFGSVDWCRRIEKQDDHRG